MAALEVRSFRNEDNSVSMVVTVPARRNGEPNFGAIARINRELLTVNPDAFDPLEPSAPTLGDVDFEADPKLLAEIERAESDDEPGALKAGEAYREHLDGTP